jgi:short-subunit dehydrogenase
MWEFTADFTSKLTLMYKDDKMLLFFTIIGLLLLLKLLYKTLAFINSYLLRLLLPLNLYSKYGKAPKPSSTTPQHNTYALITGSSRGIGENLALCLASQGFNLILMARTTELLHKVKAQVENTYKVHVIVFPCDFGEITQQALWEKIIHTIKDKDIGVLINNAGVCFYDPVQNMSLQKVNKILNVNLKGYFFLTQILLPSLAGRMEGRKGRSAVVDVASLVVDHGWEFYQFYTTTKRFIFEMSLEFGNQLRETVNKGMMSIDTLVVTPALVNTNMTPISVPGLAISADNAAWKIVKQIGRTHRTYGHYSHFIDSLLFQLPCKKTIIEN